MKMLERMGSDRRLVLSLSSVLEKLASFVKNENLELAHLARKMLIDAETPTFMEIKRRVRLSILLLVLHTN